VRRACGQGVAIHPSTRDQHPADGNVDNAGIGKREGAQYRSLVRFYRSAQTVSAAYCSPCKGGGRRRILAESIRSHLMAFL